MDTFRHLPRVRNCSTAPAPKLQKFSTLAPAPAPTPQNTNFLLQLLLLLPRKLIAHSLPYSSSDSKTPTPKLLLFNDVLQGFLSKNLHKRKSFVVNVFENLRTKIFVAFQSRVKIINSKLFSAMNDKFTFLKAFARLVNEFICS